MTELTPYQSEGIALFFQLVGGRLRDVDSLLAQEPGRDRARIRQQWVDAVYEAWSRPGVLFAWSMGAGKTLAALTILAQWHSFIQSLNLSDRLRSRLLRPALVVGPATNRFVWQEQADTHQIPLAIHTALSDMDAIDGTDLVAIGAADALVMSYTGMARNAQRLAPARFGLGVFDEAQKMANQQTMQCQAIYGVAAMRDDGIPGLPVRLALTGTPFMNHVEALWPVLAFLNGYPLKVQRADQRLYYLLRSPSNLWYDQATFERAHTAEVSRGRKAAVNLYHDPARSAWCRTHTKAECNCLHERMLRLNTHRVTAEEAEQGIPESPPPQWLPVPMGEDQERLYRHIIDRAGLPIAGRPSAIARMALMTYAFEVAASTEQLRVSLQDRDPKIDLAIDGFPVRAESSKLDEIVDMLAEFDGPALIATGFARFAKQIADDPRLADYHPVLLAGTGSLTPERFQEALWSGGHQVGVMTTMGATGLNLQCCRYVIVAGFYDWSPLIVAQAIARARRKGQTGRVLSYILYDPHSIEGWLKRKLKYKIENAAAVMDGRGDGADDLGLGEMQQAQFASLFYGEK